VRVQLLGPVRAWRADHELALGPVRQRAIFALLVLAGGEPLPRAEIVDVLWTERAPAGAVNVIHTHIKNLRRILEPERASRAPSRVLLSSGGGYALDIPPEQVDLTRFRRMVAEAVDAKRAADLPRAVELFTLALQQWRREPLSDIPFLASHPDVVAIRGERRAMLTHYAEAAIAAGAAVDALPILEQDATAHPLDEAAQARLIRAYQAAGQQARAFGAYEAVRGRLADELGVDPGAELTAAHAALLHAGAGEPVPAGVPVAAPARRERAVPRQLPADLPGFVGRAAELAQLSALCAADRQPRASIIAITGTAGVGKTALAVHWAHRVRAGYPDGQLYVDLHGYDPHRPVEPGAALTRFLTALGMADHDVALDVDQRAADYRTAIADRRMLVVLDNAAATAQVLPLLPGTPSCLVLVTSRDSLGGLVIRRGAGRVSLDLLPMPDSVALLGTLIGHRATADPVAAARLAGQCAQLPLALRVAAELANTRHPAPLSTLVSELADRSLRLERLDTEDDLTAVRSVFSWSYRDLPPLAARIFRLVGTHPGADFDAYAAAALAGTDLPRARHALRVLGRAHLIEAVGADRFGMHDLLRAYAGEVDRVGAADPADPDPDPDAGARRAALTRLFGYYLATAMAAMDRLYPAERSHRPCVPRHGGPTPPLSDEAGARAWLDTELPTLVALCQYGAGHGWHAHVAGLATGLSRYLEAGHYADALAIHDTALDSANRSGDRSGQAAAQTNLGVVYRLLGHYDLAREWLLRAAAAHRDLGERYGLARALSNLGVVEDRLGRSGAAIGYHEQALIHLREIADRHGEASTLNNLAAGYEGMGRYEDATGTYLRAIELYRELDDPVGEAIILSNLGIVETRTGRYRPAAEHQHQALAIFRRLGHRYGEAAVLNNMGDTNVRTGEFGPAAEHQHQALTIFRQLGHRYGEATALNGLGEAAAGAGRAAESRERHTAALRIAQDCGDRDEQARAHAGIARAYASAEEADRARQHWQAARALGYSTADPA
jgi:DNA-binding SARP family transcriptional activator